MEQEKKTEIPRVGDFGNCPWCQRPLTWDNDNDYYYNEEAGEDDNRTTRYCKCPNCGADIEATECEVEEREYYKNYWEEEQ